MKVFLLSSIMLLTACEALTIAGSSSPSDNVDVSVGTTITKDGIRPRGSVRVGLF